MFVEVLEAITKLNKIFKNQSWVEKDIDEFVFNNSCKLLNNLKSNEERSLIIELLERYIWISLSDYQQKIVDILQSIGEERLKDLQKIFLFPIIKPEDEDTIKSGHSLIYTIKAVKNLLPKYKHIRFEILSRFDQLEENELQLTNRTNLFLIDDYIGSGETFYECLAEVKKNKTFEYDRLVIVTLAIQNETYSELEAQSIKVYTNQICKKGISDFNQSPILEQKIASMKEIEKMIPGGNHYTLGYNQCESTITLLRTPDNTFPIFWKKYRKNGDYFDAPFSREEIL